MSDTTPPKYPGHPCKRCRKPCPTPSHEYCGAACSARRKEAYPQLDEVADGPFKRGLEAGERIASLWRRLRQARMRREQLDLPLVISLSDARGPTAEEVANWQAKADAWRPNADAEIAELESQIATERVDRGEGSA